MERDVFRGELAYMNESLSALGKRHSNMETGALSILHCLEKHHHYYFDREVSIITKHKPLDSNLQKDKVTLSERLQCILLRINQYE